MNASCGISVRDFCLGIETNSLGVVSAYLACGGDPNVPAECDTPVIGDCALVRRKSFMPLHLAVLNCFRLVETGDEESWRIAVSIVDELLKYGADVNATTSFVLRQATDLTRGGRNRINYTPLSLALLLKKELKLVVGSGNELTFARVNPLMDMLLPTPSTTIRKLLATTSVPESIASSYKELLFSTDHSDVKFVCVDGKDVPAHKALLAATSSYFASAFSGPWEENNSSGKWKTSHSSTSIKAVLTFVYIGRIDRIREDPVQVMAIADEWNLVMLKEIAITICIESMSQEANARSLDTFMGMLQFAHLHEIANLRAACFRFAKNNAAQVLMNTGVATILQNDNVGLWDELRAFMTNAAYDSLVP